MTEAEGRRGRMIPSGRSAGGGPSSGTTRTERSFGEGAGMLMRPASKVSGPWTLRQFDDAGYSCENENAIKAASPRRAKARRDGARASTKHADDK